MWKKRALGGVKPICKRCSKEDFPVRMKRDL